ncbi:hypothetical protein MHYP_G00115520 [Metynnis hypsauchen]
MTTLVLDSGAYTAKIGYSHEKVSVIPNCQFRSKTLRLKTFTANQLDEIKDPSGLFYILPFQKGYLVNWDVQRKVWDHLFGKEMFKVDFADTSVVITEPYFNFTSIQESMNEILFEEYQFQAALRINTGSLSAHRYFQENNSELCCIVVDTGFSFTHIAPYCRGRKMKDGICRINVGGKLLTNHLKEIISYRQLHVMDETHVINQVKEDVCYVSQDFYNDMEIAQLKGEENLVMRDYVLPDFSSIKKGFCKPREEMNFTGKYKTGEQILRLNNERFAVPEMLFHPSDIGIQEMGIPEALVNSINKMPEEMQPHFYKNIVLTGGNTLFPGFRDRVYKEVRALAPTEFQVSVVLPQNPICYSWEGGKLLAENPDFEEMVVTREDYEENGHYICEENSGACCTLVAPKISFLRVRRTNQLRKMASSGRKQTKKTKPTEDATDLQAFDFNIEEEKKGLSGSDDEAREETPIVDKLGKKRSASTFEENDLGVGVGNEVQTMLEKFGADISKAMQAKRKRLEAFTKSSLKGSNQKIEQLWKTQHNQRQKLTQEYSQQVFSVLQQWETDVQKSEEQEEKLNNLFRQQQKLFQQARVVQSQKLKTIKELYEQFVKNMEEMEKSHEVFLQGAQMELKKEMALLQKKIMMDTQQQEMATVRKSLQSMLF